MHYVQVPCAPEPDFDDLIAIAETKPSELGDLRIAWDLWLSRSGSTFHLHYNLHQRPTYAAINVWTKLSPT